MLSSGSEALSAAAERLIRYAATKNPARGRAAEGIADQCATFLAMSSTCAQILTDPEILGGTPVFRGTRVPVKALLDYLEGGRPLAEFLEDFPSVSREQAVEVLEHAKGLLSSSATAA